MTITLELGGVAIKVCSERELSIASMMTPFIQYKNIEAELELYLTWKWKQAYHPTSEPVGEDLLLKYYEEGKMRFCQAKGGKAPVTCTSYSEDFSSVQCAVNEEPFLEPPESLERIFQFLPMRAVFLHFRTLFLHASQIRMNGKGIVFSAPSGTGKTTQAKLWRTYMGADIICNDRTLVRKKEGIWKTYGYPMDGAEPVRSNEVNRLGCIVLLHQGKENQVERLRPAKAMRYLMEQAVIDCWDVKARTDAMELLLEILQDIPVYRQICTPDECAVKELARVLKEEGVI